MSRDWELWCIKHSWNHCYYNGTFLRYLRYIKRKFRFHSCFYCLGIFVFAFDLYIYMSQNFTFSQWGLLLKNLKIARKSSGSNSLADLKCFLFLYTFWWFYTCFLFSAFMPFSRFFNIAVCVSIFDCNWLTCSIRLLCILISSSFSVRRQSV